ncbi:MAG: cardiolipin synthase ClsB [Elusimicrobia bacterium]|nr:cardiolipin synthase ClsB [Elusimicrobiota bacterium]MDE2426030.1 cardiolipin synthase ClsB [Elusimicrobiota bacterium]
MKSPLRRLLRRKRPGSGEFSRYLDQYLPGNALTLLASGAETFRSMSEAIEQARETVHLETYMLRADGTGQEFSRRLQAKARSGVRVRVIYDSIGSLGIDPAFVHQMRNAGVQFLEYHPLAPWRPRWSWWRRDHRKALIIDGRIAFAGGVNISDDHAPIEQGGGDWHDMHARLEGPAARELDRIFRALWFKETGRWFAIPERPGPAAGSSKVWVIANQELLLRYRIRAAYLDALNAARSEVLIANAYFVPDLRTRLALAAAARRGVSVKVLLPGKSDVQSVWHAGRYAYDYLLSRGVRIYEWPAGVLHAKCAVVDGRWATVGTYNMDHRSLLSNLEVNFNVLDPAFAAVLAARLRDDIAQSPELALAAWRRRPFSKKIIESFFWLFRSLL